MDSAPKSACEGTSASRRAEECFHYLTVNRDAENIELFKHQVY